MRGEKKGGALPSRRRAPHDPTAASIYCMPCLRPREKGSIMSTYSYFAERAADERRLADHGFDHFPDEQEFAEYAFEQSDKLDALLQALGLVAERDVRGRWHVARMRREVV